LTIPEDGSLALVRDAYGAKVCGTHARLLKDVFYKVNHARPNLFGIVFDPAGLRVVLRKFGIGQTAYGAVVVKDESLRPRSALVNRQHKAFCHLASPPIHL
jgi:hypothetical protein